MTLQTSLIEGDALAQYRFTLEALLAERLSAFLEPAKEPATEYEVADLRLLEEIGQIAAELRAIGSSPTGVPF